MAEDDNRLREMVAEVAAAYFSQTHVNPSDIPIVVGQIAASLRAVVDAAPVEAVADVAAPARATSGQVRKSITPEALISFEDGRSYKTLKRHLAGRGLTPDQYRQKWGLPGDYPMVSPNYSAARSQMAKSLGLGRKVGQTSGKRTRRGS